jgi:glycosyl transferase family 87
MRRSFISFFARYPAVWLWILFVVSRAIIFLFLAGYGTDLNVHAGYIAQINRGALPFRDFFPEYPPLVFLFTCLPALIDGSLKWYFPLFRIMCCAIDCGIWIYLLHVHKTSKGNLILYILCSTAIGHLLYDHVDIVLGGMLFVAFAALLKGRNSLFHLALGMAIAFKFVPVVLVPATLASEGRRGLKSSIKCAGLLFLPTILSFAVVAAMGGYHFQWLFEYHSNRGIQIESTPATVEMVLMWFGVPGEVTDDFGSANLHTPYEQVLIHGAMVLLGAVVLFSGLMAMLRRMSSESFSFLLCGVLLASLLFSKVLSPQYFIFILPMLIILPTAEDALETAAVRLLILIIYAVTGAVFPWSYDNLLQLKFWEHLYAVENVLILRANCLALLSLYCFLKAWQTSSASRLELAGRHRHIKETRIPGIARNPGAALRCAPAIFFCVVFFTANACKADLLDQFRDEYPAAANKLNAAYSQVNIQTTETVFDDGGNVKWQFHCEYLREGGHFRKSQTFVSADTSVPTYSAVRVLGGSSEKYFDIQKAGDEQKFRVTAFGSIEEEEFLKRSTTNCVPLYGCCYADAVGVRGFVTDPAVSLVSAKTVFLDGVSVADIVADVNFAGEPHNQVHFYFLPGSWALAGFSWPVLSGSMSPNSPHQSIEQRIEYQGNDPPQIKSIDRWETTIGEPEIRAGESKISVDSIKFGPIGEEKFTLADLGVKEPVMPSIRLRMLWMLGVNAPLLAAMGTVFFVVSQRKKQVGRS